MTTDPAFEGVPFLIPARVHLAREASVGTIASDLSALIDTLPTMNPRSACGALGDADMDTAKAWARSVIRALPTLNIGADDYGNC